MHPEPLPALIPLKRQAKYVSTKRPFRLYLNLCIATSQIANARLWMSVETFLDQPGWSRVEAYNCTTGKSMSVAAIWLV
jgi:hypothetical protein